MFEEGPRVQIEVLVTKYICSNTVHKYVISHFGIDYRSCNSTTENVSDNFSYYADLY